MKHKRFLIAVVILNLCNTSTGLLFADTTNDSNQTAILNQYNFARWGELPVTPSVSNANVVANTLLGSNYVLNTHYGTTAAKGEETRYWRAYGEATFFLKEDGRVKSGQDEPVSNQPVFSVSIYECNDWKAARRMLCFSMTIGAGGAAPNTCLQGVSVGEKCFTGRSQAVPTMINFCRGNVVVIVRSTVSVLNAAREIDAYLCRQKAD